MQYLQSSIKNSYKILIMEIVSNFLELMQL